MKIGNSLIKQTRNKMVHTKSVLLYAGSLGLFVSTPCHGFGSSTTHLYSHESLLAKSKTSLNGLFDSFGGGGGSGKDDLDEEVRPGYGYHIIYCVQQRHLPYSFSPTTSIINYYLVGETARNLEVS